MPSCARPSAKWQGKIDLRGAIRRARAAELTVDPLIDVVAEFGSAVGDSVGKSYNINNIRAERWLRKYMVQRVGLINSTTRKALQEALKADDPHAAVRHVFEVARTSRAHTIAVSEVVRTSNWAAIDAGKWQGDLDLKQWISQRDAAVRPTHVALDGQIVGWLEDFTSPSGAHGPAPGALDDPAEDIACRCFSAPTQKEARRELANGQTLQAMADDLRAPMIDRLEQAWREVFDEQEAAVLAELE